MREPAARVLFLGNSHTYCNDLPLLVRDLSAGADTGPMTVADSTESGVGLAWHWNNRRSRDLIESGNFDAIVLQDRSGGPLEEPESLRKHAGLLIKAARQHGAEPVLYMTWANQDRPETLAIIATAYEAIAQSYAVRLAPVGRAWAASLAARPDLTLHYNDGRHANLAGSYLAACCLYLRLANNVRLPPEIGPRGIAAPDRAHLQQIATTTCTTKL